ncbi:MAG: hypothetical protein RJA87_805 [Pseudomonadota bacterium]|jgi:hypothetical protein
MLIPASGLGVYCEVRIRDIVDLTAMFRLGPKKSVPNAWRHRQSSLHGFPPGQIDQMGTAGSVAGYQVLLEALVRRTPHDMPNCDFPGPF